MKRSSAATGLGAERVPFAGGRRRSRRAALRKGVRACEAGLAIMAGG